jgi:co-chaperonin GroES (HSP10)
MTNEHKDVKVLRDFVLLQEVPKPKEQVGLIQIVRLDERLLHGEVVGKGTGVLTQNGQAHEIEVNIGDIYALDKMNARAIEHKGGKFLVVNELSILAVLK